MKIFKNIQKYQTGGNVDSTLDLTLPKLKPLTTKATALSSPGLAKIENSDQRLLSIYNDAVARGQIDKDAGDRFAMKHFGTAPAKFKIEQEDASFISDIINKNPGLRRKFNSNTTEELESALLDASNPESDKHKDYLKLDRVIRINELATPMPSKEGRLAVAKQIEDARKGIDFINKKRMEKGLDPISDSITFEGDLMDSGRSFAGGITIGFAPEGKAKYGRRYVTTTQGTAAHEAGHTDPTYNTNMVDTGEVYSDEELKEIFKKSPAYGNIYSGIPEEEQELLKYKWWRFPGKHDRELSEGYSDVVETQSNMKSLGYDDYSEENVRKYLDTDLGKGDRFIHLRGGKRGKWFDKTVKALNTF